ncbi:hypothetical protein RND71_022919 [Anisodus tanguticus]|uniref:Uncharacterized protein n=1 Tax=Anisodus tanguticus TaxID=243964 RepID=A0AAE1VDC5_9SOLA|nr:hypothetical protein RND71_022919 [Anisodus tanguticus]
MEMKERGKWDVSTSDVVSHFGTSGMSVAAATGITHPLDVLKVRLQMQLVGQRGPLVGMVWLQMNTRSSVGPIHEMRRIASEEGVRALWKGVGPAMERAATLTASQLATYDESKQALINPIYALFFFILRSSSTIAGTVSTLVTAPMDMVKTRLMLQRESSCAGMYRNGLHCAYQKRPNKVIEAVSAINKITREEKKSEYGFKQLDKANRGEQMVLFIM